MNTQSTQFEGSPIVGITGTFYKDPSEVRFQLSLENTERWRDAGLPLVVVDGSPGKDWVAAAHRERGAIVLASEVNGIATQRQQGARHALNGGAETLLTHEPEKTMMADFAESIADEVRSGTDIVVVGRTKESLDSLPPYQRRTEQLAGWILEKGLHLPPDALAGPRGYSVAGAQTLLDYPSKEPDMNNWIYMYQNPLDARAAGLEVSGKAVDLIYPGAMVAEETGDEGFDRKRGDQFKLQLGYLMPMADETPEAQAIAGIVMDSLTTLSEKPSRDEYTDFFGHLEENLAPHGYQVAA